MAVPNARKLLRVPGTLVKDPTDLTAAYPYGGTVLGMARGVLLKFNWKHHAVIAEEHGKQAVEVIDGGTSAVLAVTLRGYDDDAIAAVFPDTATGTPSGEKKVMLRSTSARAGSLLGASDMKLLYVPEAPLRHKAVLVREAIPAIAEEAELALSMDVELEISLAFYARPDSSARIVEIGYIKDMTL